MSVKGFAAVFGGAYAALCGSAFAQEDEAEAAGAPMTVRPVVVEMFLSQSCNASPPAAAVLSELAARPDIVALAWHVGYWDQFAAKNVGAWTDPYAQAAFAERQRAYNARIHGRPKVFTPQAVIDGFISVVGSKREAIEQRILEAQFYDEKARPTPPLLTVERGDGDLIRTRIENVGAPYDALLVKFRPTAVTSIDAGDNAGVTFREANVVRAVAPLATAHAGPGDFSFKAPKNGLDCAVIVQERGAGRIVAARYCDASE